MKSKISRAMVFLAISSIFLASCLPAVGAEGSVRFSGKLEATTYQNVYGGRIYSTDCLPVPTPIGLSTSPYSPACLTAYGEIIEADHLTPQIDHVQISQDRISWEQDPLNCTADLGEIETSSRPAPGQPNDEITASSVKYEVTCSGMKK